MLFKVEASCAWMTKTPPHHRPKESCTAVLQQKLDSLLGDHSSRPTGHDVLSSEEPSRQQDLVIEIDQSESDSPGHSPTDF